MDKQAIIHLWYLWYLWYLLKHYVKEVTTDEY